MAKKTSKETTFELEETQKPDQPTESVDTEVANFKSECRRALGRLKLVARDEMDESGAGYFIDWLDERLRDQGTAFFELEPICGAEFGNDWSHLRHNHPG